MQKQASLVTALCGLFFLTVLPSEAQSSLDDRLAKQRAEHIRLTGQQAKSLHGLKRIFVQTAGLSPEIRKQLVSQLSQIDVEIVQMAEAVTMNINDGILTVNPENVAFPGGLCTVDLDLTQDCLLERDPSSKIRARTYNDFTLTNDNEIGKGVAELTSRFVINFLKANAQAK